MGGERPGRRARAKSAALWGLVGALAFLVAVQAYLLSGGDLPVGYGWVAALAAVVGAAAGGTAYLTEHRLEADRLKRRT